MTAGLSAILVADHGAKSLKGTGGQVDAIRGTSSRWEMELHQRQFASVRCYFRVSGIALVGSKYLL